MPVAFFKKCLIWKKTESKFAIFVEKWKSKRNITGESSGNLAIVIQPWSGTAIPWFLITIALFFLQSNKKVTLIVDDLEFGKEKWFFRCQIRSIKKILLSLPSSIKIIELTYFKRNKKKFAISDNSIIDNISTLNTIHFMRGELIENHGRKEYFNTIHKQLENTFDCLNQAFNENHFDFIIVPGGIWGSSGLYLILAELYKIRVSTYDSGFGTISLNTLGVASYQSDIPLAFSQLEEINSDKIINIANEEMEKRKLGTEKHSPQHPSNQKKPFSFNKQINDVGILMLPNIVFDVPALGLHTVFESMADWIIESIEWTLENSDEIITIRQHPHERTVSGKSNDDYYLLIKQKFGNNDRIRFISATDDINTYNLIENSRFVITFSTTASMEAVVMGKVVINVSSCYYSDLGFVYNSKTKEEYFTHIKNALSGEIKVSEKQKEDSLKCYYLSQCCNRIYSIFTPQPVDFENWVKLDPEEIFQLEEVKQCLYAIENGIPISLIRHHDFMKSCTSKSN